MKLSESWDGTYPQCSISVNIVNNSVSKLQGLDDFSICL